MLLFIISNIFAFTAMCNCDTILIKRYINKLYIGVDVMLSEALTRKFLSKESKNPRQQSGYLAGAVGIAINLMLFGVKLAIGTISNSIAITADAFNNLSDMGSCLITIVGFKIADKPADKNHPFGHGRGEYIAGLVVSFMVLYVGIQFVKTSVGRILHPEETIFDIVSFIVLVISISAKLWLGKFYNHINKKVASGTLDATTADSYSDALITSSTAVCLLLSRFIAFPIDGYAGLVVSGFILYAGFGLIRDTISPLLGEAPSPELVRSITQEVLSNKGIIGVHDLIIHTYGSGKYMASIHAEVPSDIPIMDCHEIVDRAEAEISQKLDILLVIHMDPVNLNNEEIKDSKAKIIHILRTMPEILSLHDFRIVGTDSYKNVLFDIVLSNQVPPSDEDQVKERLVSAIKAAYPEMNPVITVDRNYIHA
jgi:cation diffusion facilitator family transporter